MVRMDWAASAMTLWVAWVWSVLRGRVRHQLSSAMIRLRGVRSSCESSPVSCLSCRRSVRMRSSMASNDAPRRASSAGWRMLPKRSSEATALHWVAWSVIVRTGRSARPTASRVRA